MKKITVFILLIINSSFFFAQKQKAEISFRDGNKLTGLIRLTKSGEIKFFQNEKSKAIKYLNEDIKEVKIYETENVKYLYSILIVSEGTFKLLEEVLNGKVILYKNVLRNYGLGNNHTQGMIFNDDTYNKYYVKRENENAATNIGVNVMNIRKAKKYFSDCKIFLDRLNERKFKKQNILQIIEFYNKECTN